MKVLFVFGTRPEAIKMAPIIKKMQSMSEITLGVCVTAQHREMLDQILEVFKIVPDYDLNVMRQNQGLYDITSIMLLKLKEVYNSFNPDIVLVHGDTTTAFVSALAAFYSGIKVGHIEAGLRTYNLCNPFPEEANRQLVGVLSALHFAPTQTSANNLISEGKDKNNVYVVGNTVIDALFWVLNRIKCDEKFKDEIISSLNEQYQANKKRKIILVTGHRRENFGKGFVQICEALRDIALKNPGVDIVYPVHLNPNVQKPVNEILSGISNIYLIRPLKYQEFVYLMFIAYIIITDSGGIQEEAPSLGKPVLVMRNTTERPEAVEAGVVKLVGISKDKIIDETEKLLENQKEYENMSKSCNPYGNGDACEKIIQIIKERFKV